MSTFIKFLAVSLCLTVGYFIAPFIGYLLWGIATLIWIVFCAFFAIAKIEGKAW